METPTIAPLSGALLAHDRNLAVAEPLSGLLPSGSLVRGQVIGCRGLAAWSLAFGLTTAAAAGGSWIAVVDVDGLGSDAVRDLGIPLERLVRVDTGRQPQRWAEAMSAALDGFELVVTTSPARAGGLWSRLQRRVAARQAVVIAIDPANVPVDVALTVTEVAWQHAGTIGRGHLVARRVTVQSSGRRVPATRTIELWLPDPDGRKLAVLEPGAAMGPGMSAAG